MAMREAPRGAEERVMTNAEGNGGVGRIEGSNALSGVVGAFALGILGVVALIVWAFIAGVVVYVAVEAFQLGWDLLQ